MKTHSFHTRVYEAVSQIPLGRVLTYGQIARLVGSPHGARAVGWALRQLPPHLERRVPWHRVVASGGKLSPRVGVGAKEQRLRLLAEGVRFQGSSVDLARHGLKL